jgi:hypothetical protein
MILTRYSVRIAIKWPWRQRLVNHKTQLAFLQDMAHRWNKTVTQIEPELADRLQASPEPENEHYAIRIKSNHRKVPQIYRQFETTVMQDPWYNAPKGYVWEPVRKPYEPLLDDINPRAKRGPLIFFHVVIGREQNT